MIDLGGKVTGGAPLPSDPPATQVLEIACVDYTRTELANHLYALDPGQLDHFAVAVMLADCGRSSDCLADVNTAEADAHDKYLAGLMAWYAHVVDPDQVSATLQTIDVPPAAARIFMTEFTSTRQEVAEISKGMDGIEREVFLDIPVNASREVVEAREAHAQRLAEVEALTENANKERASGVRDETVAGLETLRREYVAACGAFACLRDPVGQALAEELFRAHISRTDVLAARAELTFLPEGRFADVVEARQRRAMDAHAKADDQVERGVRNGLDEATARATTEGVQPWSFEGVYPVRHENRRKPWDNMIPPPPGRAQLVQKTWPVRRKVVNGVSTTLEFLDDVRTWKQESCRDTNRVERIEDGRVYYKQNCHLTGKTESLRTKRDPVVVPTSEATAIGPKDEVSLWIMTGAPWTGRVITVERKGEPVQVRDVRLK
jgi:hypothetical protein